MKAHLVENEQNVVVGQDLCTIDVDASADSAAPSAPAPQAPTSTPEPQASAPPASPAAHAASAPPSIHPSSPVSSPPFSKTPSSIPSATQPPAPKPAAAPQQAPQKIVPGSRTERVVPLTRMRLRIAERLKEAQNTAAILTTFNEVDMSKLMEFRSMFKEDVLKKHGVKLGYMSAFVAASVKALQDIPGVNARIQDGSIVYSDFADISVAVATPKGLVTPVVRNAEQMSLVEIEKEIAFLGQKARDGKLALEDLSGGTFTISNGGVFGSMMGTPIINAPQSAILGMHAIQKRAVVVGDKIEIRPMMYLALSYDHRLVDGREAVTFLVHLKNNLENPSRLLLDL
ncbi:Dihydrolipoyllysine-residue succinyltransferase component of 2-oxoglutarate dehydrogenase complex, m [Smittium mucronatum]|uniref:dihydrolipoyllysine-residue succinyltransferase n=1 Tax=Smittium mucronatum TaxID=133383 RepID=A0A1R0GR85_9FUNG|nr:Dihydrolipoyllysine-residue succinyltransferase component of 2-oxoglutarate dehydrogenase complex, m [Smittium mucronatum]